MKQIIAAFDFDGTITCKDTLWEFLKHTHSPLQIAVNFIIVFPYILLYKAGLMNNGKAKQKLFSVFYKNWSVEQFDTFCKSFQSIIDNCIRSDVYRQFKRHQTAGHKVLIVSASIENWIMPWAKRESVSQVIATQIEVNQQGILTGRFLTPNCYGKEKVRRLLQFFPERDSYTFIAYGDSKGDREILKFADEKHPTNSKLNIY